MEPKHCPCIICKKYIATKNCYSCSAALCTSCVFVSIVKFSDTITLKANSDFELLERCQSCVGAGKLPQVVSGSECSIQ